MSMIFCISSSESCIDETIFTIAVDSRKNVKNDTENVDDSVFFLTLTLSDLLGPDNGKNKQR